MAIDLLSCGGTAPVVPPVEDPSKQACEHLVQTINNKSLYISDKKSSQGSNTPIYLLPVKYGDEIADYFDAVKAFTGHEYYGVAIGYDVDDRNNPSKLYVSSVIFDDKNPTFSLYITEFPFVNGRPTATNHQLFLLTGNVQFPGEKYAALSGATAVFPEIGRVYITWPRERSSKITITAYDINTLQKASFPEEFKLAESCRDAVIQP